MAADGSLKFDTKIDTSGLEKGTGTLEKAFDRLTKAVDRLSDNISSAFNNVGQAASIDNGNKVHFNTEDNVTASVQ